MSMRQVETDILINNGTDEPYYLNVPAIDRLSILKYKIDNNDTDYITAKLTYNTVKTALLENRNIDDITNRDWIRKKDYNDISRYTDYDKFLSIFIKNKIGVLLNITFDDFLRKNMIEIDSIIRVTDKINSETSIANTTIINKELANMGLGG